MEFTDLLDEYLAAKKVVDDLRERFNPHNYQSTYSFSDIYYSEYERYQNARTRLNDFVNKKDLYNTRFGG